MTVAVRPESAEVPASYAGYVGKIRDGEDLMAVLAGTMRTRARSTSSSSATIWATAVSIPWPISTLPENTSTIPSARRRNHCDRRRLVCRLPGSVCALPLSTM